MNLRTPGFVVFAAALALAASQPLRAHCDTMDGPVITDARAALNTGDVTPVLKWISKDFEPEIRTAFARTLKVRAAAPEARELADTYFFETLVRVHRAGEGEPYTGLKPAGAVDPAVELADKALQTGSADPLVQLITQKIQEQIRHRFERAVQSRRTADQSTEAGRQYVAAYVELMHYMEQLNQAGGEHGEKDTNHGNHTAKR
ncbi:MAG: DUF6448 family protein [Rhodospirillales bacterium]